jgi:hypothetical protein
MGPCTLTVWYKDWHWKWYVRFKHCSFFFSFFLQCNNFEVELAGIKQQLQQLYCLLSVTLPDLATHFQEHRSENMFFWFRSLMVLFKREFSYQDIMRLWEVYWTDLPCQNFHLLFCVAILDSQQHFLIENNYGHDAILKVIGQIYYISAYNIHFSPKIL